MFQKLRLCSVGERSGFMGMPACSSGDEECIAREAARILNTGGNLPGGIIQLIISALITAKHAAIFIGATGAKWILTIVLQIASTAVQIAGWKIRAIIRLADLLFGFN